jgi:formamidopyrimidine-DNA glycosylase
LIAQYEGEILFTSRVQPHLQDMGVDAAMIEQLPTPIQAVIKGILPKSYFGQNMPKAEK